MDQELAQYLAILHSAAYARDRRKLTIAKKLLKEALSGDERLRKAARDKVASLNALAKACGGEQFLHRRDWTGKQTLEYLREALSAGQGN